MELLRAAMAALAARTLAPAAGAINIPAPSTLVSHATQSPDEHERSTDFHRRFWPAARVCRGGGGAQLQSRRRQAWRLAVLPEPDGSRTRGARRRTPAPAEHP